MAVMTYPDHIPQDSRWMWRVRVPESVEDQPAERIVAWAQHALAHYGIGYAGGPAEVALMPFNGNKYLLFKADTDPADVVVPADVPPLPPPPEQQRIARLRQAQTTLRGGTSLNAAQLRTVLADLIDMVLGDDR